ncbi:hypothetical protein, partial [Enterobacter hormaechei]
ALKRMHAAVAARHDALVEAVIEEYPAPGPAAGALCRGSSVANVCVILKSHPTTNEIHIL